MKRSEINKLIGDGIKFLDKIGYHLPPQALWSLDDWYANRNNGGDISKRGIGWDLTDFGSGDFNKIGLLLYTLSNGIIGKDGLPIDQPYANKILIVGEEQLTPMHHHGKKMEDIAVLGGGYLQILLCNSADDGSLDRGSNVGVLVNNVWQKYQPETIITLEPGNRIRLDTHHYHEFWGKKGKGKVLAEEVSMVNDDRGDNFFLNPVGRFPTIEEDIPPKYLLCTELPGTKKFNELVKQYLHVRDKGK